MKITKILAFAIIAVLLWSCGNDDDMNIEVVPPRLLSEVAVEDDAEIKAYLETHFYNYEEFAAPPADFDFRIVIDTIAGENAGKTPLMSQVETETVAISSSDFLLDDGEENVIHTYYYLEAREGDGASPTFADSTFVRFEGTLLNGTVFDAVNTVSTFDLPTFQFPGPGSSRAFRGVSEGIQRLKTGSTIIDNPNGTFDVEGSGIGMVIFPSGLGTFNGNRASIPQYSPLIFKLEILVTLETDHDNDGIPSIMEDLDGDGLLFNDNTDLDIETSLGFPQQFPNYLDSDDDNDGIPTREEIEIATDGTITFPDSDGDGIPDYLDGDS
ncbi:MAG: hypothetical protein WBG90_11340 [Saonia sp.]